MSVHRLFLSLTVILMLPGCTTVSNFSDVIKERNPLAIGAGGASLRVSVDVYKGNLGSVGAEQNRAHRKGIINTIHSIMPLFNQHVEYDESTLKCTVYFSKDEVDISEELNTITAKNCSAIYALTKAYRALSNLTTNDITKDMLVFSNQTASLATLYARTALEYSNARGMRKDSIRRLVAVANSLRHVSDQIDVAVQYGSSGARGIPLSAHLRATNTENFTDLYTWSNLADMKWFSSSTIQSDRDAAIALKMLDEKNYWENINQAYASGAGEFSVALIKDDIGNWDIKNFANDPTELRNAQQKLAIDLIGKLASEQLPINSSISSAQKIADFANGRSTVTAHSEIDTGLTKELDSVRRTVLLSQHKILEAASADWAGIPAFKEAVEACEAAASKTKDEKEREIAEAEKTRAQAQDDLNDEIARLESTPDIATADNTKMSDLQTKIGSLQNDIEKAEKAKSDAASSCNTKIAEQNTAIAARTLAYKSFFDNTARQVAQSHQVLNALEAQNNQREEVVIKAD